MGRYITTKADFTLRRKHKKGPSGTTIYENDYTTINPMPNALKGEYVIGDSNFIFTSRLGINAQKKHVRGKFVPNPSGTTDEGGAWTMDTMIDSGITNETKIRLKPNYTSIRDFACYGSAIKLIQGTINGVITDFPAEMWLSGEELALYGPDEGKAGYSFNEDNAKYYKLSGNVYTLIETEEEIDEMYEKLSLGAVLEKATELPGVTSTSPDYVEVVAVLGNLLYNEYAIDITTSNIRPESVYNPLRYFTLCGSSYTYVEGDDVYEFSGFTVTPTALGACYRGKSVSVDKLAEVTMVFANKASVSKTLKIDIFKDYEDESVYYIYAGVPQGGRIRPKNQIIEDYFRDCDDFTAVLLERTAKPIYTATFETPKETETGYVYDMVTYTWPTLLGGYNPDLSGAYYAYVEGLMHVAEFYDEHYSDNMWRSLTHEAIKTLDWTYVSNSDGDVEDMSTIDTSRIEPITKIYGRQFDDLKRYADGIKTINTVTYDQKSNTPDYTLTDILENAGWETKTLKITSDNNICTPTLYPGLTSGYTSSDANNEFLRRMKLNSKYLLSAKGTRKGLDAMLGMFGFRPEEYSIKEYVYVFSGNTFPHFCSATTGNDEVAYPLAKDISTINKYKVNFNALDPYGDYCGIPVAEIGYSIENPEDPDNPIDCSYVVPWFSYGKKYDDGLYFQKHGGWGKRKAMDIELEIASGVSSITAFANVVPLYMETQARLKFAKDFDELLQQAYSSSNYHDVSYVTDISKIEDMYSPGFSAETSAASHYFVLENEDLNQFLGFSVDADKKYGWRSIPMQEIENPSAYTAGTLVLYLESIKDDTTGNNPHIGNGTYDDGMSYVSGMSEIFAYSLINKNFIGITDSTCAQISKLKFGVERYEDNRKCWFFTDDYNKKSGKELICGSGTNIEFREVDVTDEVCKLHNCNDSIINRGSGCDSGVAYDIIELLSAASSNQAVKIGASAETYFTSGTSELYGRTSGLITFDPERKRVAGDNGEAQANSVVNVKNLDVTFNIPSGFGADVKIGFRQYIETSVIPYLTQMIPSTSILSWSFNTDADDSYSGGTTPTPEIPSAETLIYELEFDPNESAITITSAGTSCFTVNYVTKTEAGVVKEREDVTDLIKWSSNDTSIAVVSDDGCITGRNDDPFNSAKTMVIAEYPYGYAYPITMDVTVEKAGLPTIDIIAPDYIDATATTLPYTAICDTDVVVKCLTQTKDSKTGNFIVPENATTDQVKYTISAVSTDYPSIQTFKEVIQRESQAVTTVISISAYPREIPAEGSDVNYIVSVSPSETRIKVKCGTTERTVTSSTFTFQENTQETPITHVISAWCVDSPGVSATTTVKQAAKACETPYFTGISLETITEATFNGVGLDITTEPTFNGTSDEISLDE